MKKQDVKNNKIKVSKEELEAKEIPLLFSVVNFSSNLHISMYVDSIGIKTSESSYRAMMYSEVNRNISEEYLLNSKKSSIDLTSLLNVGNYSLFPIGASLSNRKLLEDDVHKKGNAIKLPNYKNLNAPIGAVIRSRRSRRDFKGEALTLVDLSTLLYYGDGISGDFSFNFPKEDYGTITLGDEYISKVRTAPSGGGLYPIYLYIVALNIKGIEKGVYKYMPYTHSLEKIKIFSDEDVENYCKDNVFGGGIDLRKTALSVYYVYSLFENTRKYGDMALSFALIETGEIAQNIQLAAAASGISACDIGGFNKSLSEQLLNIDGQTNHVVHLTLLSK
ncbi:SagB/ThcOx family dehydrogenase [Brachyspira hyodysenteriae]|uniref:Streptolysin associated protein SagB n=2 Tax=Brachyspira hyodysenteriae TaxID=159 RepID=A0A3B6VD90_BRAHW|nr:SagB/ThcOx family dehydrogenase [Brachyspira hyodysenteriae]ACN84807.1 streptolysin associated protein SagB [Brachyspira hyodysenteriae WA1]ANN63136.1 streptolysin associated protein SagB [Brachyspira hyodysenteriae ATCC 27164]AUJ50533.1 streptolysin associated protein SagB [Brachyspira hyodysenteriae]KLI16787.1 streptolysin associated protein SagB [Brachyspira hyodysenteriae]KLI20624.1 streptolysin associated protein SagB [Brachyspira hyodysenteriae]